MDAVGVPIHVDALPVLRGHHDGSDGSGVGRALPGQRKAHRAPLLSNRRIAGNAPRSVSLYLLFPSKCWTSSAPRSTPSRQRTLIEFIGVPSGLFPEPNDEMPHVLQNV